MTARDALARVKAYCDAIPTLYDEGNPMPEGLSIDAATDWSASPSQGYELTYELAGHSLGVQPTCPTCGLVVNIRHGIAECGLGHDVVRCSPCGAIHMRTVAHECPEAA